MNERFQKTVSFVVMAILIFIAVNLLDRWSTGPHRHIAFGVTSWLEVHLHRVQPTVHTVYYGRLAMEICIVLAVTAVLDAILSNGRDRI